MTWIVNTVVDRKRRRCIRRIAASDLNKIFIEARPNIHVPEKSSSGPAACIPVVGLVIIMMVMMMDCITCSGHFCCCVAVNSR